MSSGLKAYVALQFVALNLAASAFLHRQRDLEGAPRLAAALWILAALLALIPAAPWLLPLGPGSTVMATALASAV